MRQKKMREEKEREENRVEKVHTPPPVYMCTLSLYTEVQM